MKRKLKVLLVNPPQVFPKKYYSKNDIRVSVPLGLLSVAGNLEKAGYETALLDSFTYNNKFLVTETADEIILGAPYKTLEREIKKLKPDVVGVSSPFSTQIKNSFRIAEIVKSIDQNILVVGGGPHASVRPEDYFKTGFFDAVIMAEGEKAFVDLLDKYDGKIKNIEKISNLAFVKDGNVMKNTVSFIKDLDSLAFPAYHLCNIEKYFEIYKKGFVSRPFISSNRIISMITSRGCPFNCVFCSIHTHMGRGWRYHSAEYVLEHIELLVKNYGIKHISFEDDNLTVNIKRFEKILDGIISKQKDDKRWRFTWDTPNGVRADTLNKSILKKAKKSGLLVLVIAIESGDQKIIDEIIDKKLKLEDAVNVARWCKEVGITLSAFFVIGFPGEKKKNIDRTFDLALFLNKKYDVLPSIAIATPLFNTRLYDIVKRKGYLTEEVSDENLITATMLHGKGLIKTKDFSPKDLVRWSDEFHKRLMMQQLLKPQFVIRRFMQSPTLFFSMARRAISKIIK